MINNISTELLKKYINGECTDEEVQRVKTWYATFENDDDLISALSEDDQMKLESQMLNEILNNIQGKKKPIKYIWLKTFAIAASVLVIVSLFLINNKSDIKTNLHQLSIINNTKSIYKQTLPDGSIVWLSPGANLQYPIKFSGSSRLVSMKGECFFEVTKDAAHPFIINSGTIITKVWGTSFRVRDFNNMHKAEVSVVTGKVSVSINNLESVQTNSGEVMLYPKQKASFNYQNNQLTAGKETDEASVKIWVKTKLSFDNVPLKEIISVLDQQFSVDIKVNNEKINATVLSADLADFNLPEILEIFKKSLGIDYEINGNIIYLTSH